MRYVNPRTFTLASTMLFGFVLAGCNESITDGDDAPVLPAPESMEFDLSFFDAGANPAPAASAPAGVAGTHWTAAAVSVAVANLAVVIHTAIPLATWRAARAQQPVFEDDQWHWRFSTNHGGETYSGDLTGYIEGGDLIAEMRITATALDLEDFLWYVGTAPVGGTTGTWEFYDAASPTTVAGTIDWQHPGTAVWTVSFNAETGANAGDVLTYEVNGNARSVSFSDASAGTTVEIEWNAATNVGSITAPDYNSGARACWDTTLANATCS